MEPSINAIVTGASGMVGEGVVHECLQHPAVASVLVIGRKPCGIRHARLKELILPNLSDLSSIEDQLSGYNACFFCLGVSSVGMKEVDYRRITYDLTMQVAVTLSRIDPGMTFCYVSGAGTDSTEKGRLMWARVKGKTENDLFKLPFRRVFAFRPGFIRATEGLQHTHKFYKYISWMYPIGRRFFPNGFSTLREVGLAMIQVALSGYSKNIIEGKDIAILAENAQYNVQA